MTKRHLKSIALLIGFALLIGASTALHAQKSLRARSRKAKSSVSRSTGPNKDNGLPNGKLITFVDGGTLHVDDAWWRGEDVWYSRGGVTETASRKVKSIEPVFLANVEPKINATKPPLGDAPNDSAEKGTSMWIYLAAGARFRADQVRETTDGVWYQRGNLLSFLERGRVERVERELPFEANQPGWQERGWTSGNPAIDQSIRTNGSRFGVDPYLVFLVIEQESQFRPRAVSPKGARGLMQLMPGTARRFDVRKPFDPIENIRGGTQYLKELMTMFKGRVDLALASYNAGEGRVISYGNKVPPFQETQNYVKRISQRYRKGDGIREHPRRARVRNNAQSAVTEESP